MRFLRPVGAAMLLLVGTTALCAQSPSPLSWEQVKARFQAANPALRADALALDESRAAEATAFLRPNPQFTFANDGTQLAPYHGVWQPLSSTQLQSTLSYLHERDRKRELRLQAAKDTTRVASDQHDDLQRNLEFTLRLAFLQTLQAKATLKLATADLDYYDKLIAISRDRFRAGDLAQIDLDRIELQRVQYESELESATVNLRTSKIQLLQLLNDRTPTDSFDVDGPFDFAPELSALPDIETFHQTALDSRPDLRAALDAITLSETNHKLAQANGSTDPTLSAWETFNPSFNNPNDKNTLGLSVNIPLRIFDRNQGEKRRTLIDIDRSRQLSDAARAQVFADVDSSWQQVRSSIALLTPYKAHYLDQATRVRDTVTYAWQHGGASLMDFLNAQSDYRQVQLAYLQLIGSYKTAVSQLNLAVGREVIQ